MMAIKNDPTENSYALQKLEAVNTKLEKELNNDKASMEFLFELACRVAVIIANVSSHQVRDTVKELTHELSKQIKMQKQTYGTLKVSGAKYSAAAIQIGAAAVGIGGFATANQGLSSLAMPVSYAGQGIGGIAQTSEEGINAERLTYQHLAEEAKRQRDESSGNKSRYMQNSSEVIQIYRNAIEQINRAKTSAVAQ